MTETATTPQDRRNRLLLILAVILGGALLAWGLYWAFQGRYHETTDDAYVAGHVVAVTAQVAGTVTDVAAVDTQFVKAGQTLVQLDQTDTKLALENAEAALGRAVRDVRSLVADRAGLAAAVRQREADLARAREDMRRRRQLVNSGAVTDEDMTHSASALAAAEAALAQAREQLTANAAQTAGTRIVNHPMVAAAAAQYKNAYLNHQRTIVAAPVSGLVAKRTVQAGQRVSIGATLMSVVPLDAVWVEANFKEVQLRQIRIGHPVRLTADVYGRNASYHGRVIGIGAGTGSAFAILPAQNATGNWIKLVQRVPVRIALDPRDLAENPLRIGLSMTADIDTREDAVPTPPASVTPVAASEANLQAMAAADRRVLEIIRLNLAAEPAR
jgi:membrane fusion protein (multidrug efflux system)